MPVFAAKAGINSSNINIFYLIFDYSLKATVNPLPQNIILSRYNNNAEPLCGY